MTGLLAAEASPGRRQLLADSLLIELAARATARRQAEKSLSTLTCSDVDTVLGVAAALLLGNKEAAARDKMAS
jgi:hypothetical protein